MLAWGWGSPFQTDMLFFLSVLAPSTSIWVFQQTPISKDYLLSNITALNHNNQI